MINKRKVFLSILAAFLSIFVALTVVGALTGILFNVSFFNTKKQSQQNSQPSSTSQLQNPTQTQTENKPQDQSEQVVRIAYQHPSNIDGFPIYVAQQEGLFEKYNLKADLTREITSSDAAKALLSKTADYMPFVAEGVIASQKGDPIKTVMVFAQNSPLYLLVRPEIEMKNIKTISIVPYSMVNYLTLKLISEEGLSATIMATDTTIMGRALGLMSGRFDAVVAAAPGAFVLQNLQGKNPVLLKTIYGEIGTGIVTTNDKIKNNPKEVKKIIEIMQSAIFFIQNNPEETKKLLFSFYSLENNDANRKTIDKTYELSKEIFINRGLPAESSMNKLIQIAKAGQYTSIQDVDRQTVTPEDVSKTFDFQFLK